MLLCYIKSFLIFVTWKYWIKIITAILQYLVIHSLKANDDLYCFIPRPGLLHPLISSYYTPTHYTHITSAIWYFMYFDHSIIHKHVCTHMYTCIYVHGSIVNIRTMYSSMDIKLIMWANWLQLRAVIQSQFCTANKTFPGSWFYMCLQTLQVISIMIVW